MKKLKQNQKEVSLEFGLPEFKKEDIKVKISKNSLAIKASTSIDKSVQRKDFFHEEKRQHAFNYTTTLPSVDHKKAKVEFKNGILRIKIPRL